MGQASRGFRGVERKKRAAAAFTDEEVRAIRRADEARTTTRLEQARFWGVGKETIARICRGETYYWVAEADEAVGSFEEGRRDKRGNEIPVMGEEPTREEILASQERLADLMAAEGHSNKLVEELRGHVEEERRKMDETPDDPGVGGD